MPSNRSVVSRTAKADAIAIWLVEAIDVGVDLIDIRTLVRLGASAESPAVPGQATDGARAGNRSIGESTFGCPLRNGSAVCDSEAKRAILLDIDLLSDRKDLSESETGGGLLETAEDSDVLLGCCMLEKVHRGLGEMCLLAEQSRPSVPSGRT